MADMLQIRLESARTPAEFKDPARWPPAMRDEWDENAGLAAARRHREEVVGGFRAARAALDAFRPDLVLIFGDDQHENFRDDAIPPFCVYAMETYDCALFKNTPALRATTNIWGESPETVVQVRGHQEAANHLAHSLIRDGFDVACAYQLHHARTLSHAFVRTLLYLDYDRHGIDYPIVPVHVNCYGSDLRIGPRSVSPDSRGVEPPPSPMPWRCYDLGKAVARILGESPWRAAVIGSSGWSHASLTAKHHYLYPDVEADRQRLGDLQRSSLRAWRDLDPAQIRESGQHEILNWVCLAGAMEGRECTVLAYGETYLFNSNKPVVLFPMATT
jgi:hypothetical protein